MNELAFQKRITELENLDSSRELSLIPRKEWTAEMKEKTCLWQVPKTTANLLYKLVTEKKPSLVLELGTSGGYSSLWIAKALFDTNTTSTIHTIEFSPKRAIIAKETFCQVECTNIIQHIGKIHSFIQPWQYGLIDFLFIDADKPSYLTHFKMLEPYLASDALIVVDNMLDDLEKVKSFKDYVTANYKTELFEIDNGVLVIFL